MTELNDSLFLFFNNFAGQSAALDWVIVFFANYLAYILVAIVFGLVFFLHTEKIKKVRFGLTLSLAAILSRGVVVSLIRFFYHHPRPFLVLPTHLLFSETSYSFPSGHATFFFALSAVIYARNRSWGITFFILSFLMGLARVAAGVHYPFDILGGAILGILCGFGAHLLINLYVNLKSDTSPR